MRISNFELRIMFPLNLRIMFPLNPLLMPTMQHARSTTTNATNHRPKSQQSNQTIRNSQFEFRISPSPSSLDTAEDAPLSYWFFLSGILSGS